MRVLLTGAEGRLGQHVAQALMQANLDVIATDLTVRGRLTQLDVIPADLSEPGHAHRLMDGCEAVIHLGNVPNAMALDSHLQVMHVNNRINANITEAMLSHKVRIACFASSIQAQLYLPMGLPDRPRPRPWLFPSLPLRLLQAPRPGWNGYALSKLAGESMFQAVADALGDTSYALIRYPQLIWEADYTHWLTKRHVKHPGAMRSGSQEAWSHLTVSDAVDLIVAWLDRQPIGCHTLFPAITPCFEGLSDTEAIDRLIPGVRVDGQWDARFGWVDVSPLDSLMKWTPPSARPVIPESIWRPAEQKILAFQRDWGPRPPWPGHL